MVRFPDGSNSGHTSCRTGEGTRHTTSKDSPCQVSHQKPELTRLASKVPRKLPKLPARRNALVEKVMPSVENVEKVGIPLPKVKGEKVEKEKRNKYLKAVVYSTMALSQEKGDTWTHVRGRSQAAIMSRIAKDFPFPDFPWDKKPVIKKHFALAFKTGLEQGILVQQVTIVHVACSLFRAL